MPFDGIWASMLNNRAKKGFEKVLDNLELYAGDIIADIGSGGGFFSFEMAKQIGSNGKVFAVDTNENLLGWVKKAAQKMHLQNIKTVVAEKSGPSLPKESCDLIFMRNVLHHIENPVLYFKKLKLILKPNGRIAILEWKETSGGFVGRAGHCMPEAEIKRILLEAGFLHIKSVNGLNNQSFNIFRKETN